MFNHDPYPSYGIFSIASMAAYLGFATNEFADVLTAMGENWKTRSMVAYIFMALIVVTFILTRIFLSECDDTLGEIMISVSLAVIVGALFYYMNRSLFGKESMNLLGLPTLDSKDKNGNAIYICAAT
jgi:predicted membrane channel-forming protein YqfA (hemolysin III family)